MRITDNGEVAIGIEPVQSIVRMYGAVPLPGKRLPYVAVGQITRLPQGVVLFSGFHGEMRRAHLWLLLQAMVAEGFTVAYMERIAGHSVPFGEIVDDGDFAGLWRIQLDTVRDRRRRREMNDESMQSEESV